MSTSTLQSQITDLYTTLVNTFGAARQDQPALVDQAYSQSIKVGHSLSWMRIRVEDLVDPLLSVIILLDHVGLEGAAIQLLHQCSRAARDTPVAVARFASAKYVIHDRHGISGMPSVPLETSSAPGQVMAQLMVNVALARRYDSDWHDAGSRNRREPVFPAGSIAHFALTSLTFDQAVFAARLSDARVALGRLEQLANAIMNELGERHPYLGLVLITLASAKCSLAAVEGNIQDLRRYADVLSVAVQRASAQLGPHHVQTIGGMANLAYAEFEIALASRSVREVMECRNNLSWLADYIRQNCAADHPTAIILAMNTAVAGLECARLARSTEQLAEAEHMLRVIAGRAETRFGRSHPCTAIAQSNAASAGFDLARARHSRPELEQMVDVLENAVSQATDSLGAGHATARALSRQLRACHRLLASDDPWTDGPGGGTGTIVRTVEDELWGIDDDYVPIYQASPPPPAGSSRSPVVPIRRERLINLDEDQLAEAGYTVEIDADGELVYRDRTGNQVADPESIEVLITDHDSILHIVVDDDTPPRGLRLS